MNTLEIANLAGGLFWTVVMLFSALVIFYPDFVVGRKTAKQLVDNGNFNKVMCIIQLASLIIACISLGFLIML